jgi:hypothetical protein
MEGYRSQLLKAWVSHSIFRSRTICKNISENYAGCPNTNHFIFSLSISIIRSTFQQTNSVFLSQQISISISISISQISAKWTGLSINKLSIVPTKQMYTAWLDVNCIIAQQQWIRNVHRLHANKCCPNILTTVFSQFFKKTLYLPWLNDAI